MITRFIAKLFVGILANGLGLYLVHDYVTGAAVPITFDGLVIAAVILTLINIFIAPIIRLILSPLIFLTFGLAGLLVNGIVLYMLTFILPSIQFDGFVSLAYATLIVGLVNLAVNLVL